MLRDAGDDGPLLVPTELEFSWNEVAENCSEFFGIHLAHHLCTFVYKIVGVTKYLYLSKYVYSAYLRCGVVVQQRNS